MTRFMLEVGQATDIGRQRERNEDFYASYLPSPGEPSDLGGLLLVADGMGGELGGAQASRLAVERVMGQVRAETSRVRLDYDLPEQLSEMVRRVVRETSDHIHRQGQSDPGVRSMGSTLVLAMAYGDQIVVAHVGDSRCYRVRQGRIERLTTDHTWVAAQVEAGHLSAEDAEDHPQRHVLTRTLGDTASPGVDVRIETLEDEDLFLLCTDGLTNALSDVEIEQICQRFPSPLDVAEALVALANEQDGSDNATAVVCRCHDLRQPMADPEATEPILRPEALDRRLPVARRRIVLGALLALLLAAVVFGPRFLAARAFERGVDHANKGEYLHARQEFSTAIRLGLDARRTQRLIDRLLAFPSKGRREGAEPPPAGEGNGTSAPPDDLNSDRGDPPGHARIRADRRP